MEKGLKRKIEKIKLQLEKALKVKINTKGEEISVSGESWEEYIAKIILEAIEMGFELQTALQLRNEDFMFEKLKLKEWVRPSRLKTVTGRIIGERGRTLRTLQELTDCEIIVKDSTVGVIGKSSDVDITIRALKSLVQGSPHANVYAWLEKSRKMKKIRAEDESILLDEIEEESEKAEKL